MTNIKNWFSKPSNRNYIYLVARALIVLFVALGFVVPGLDETIMVLIGALLGLGTNELAKHNLSPEEQAEDEAVTE